MRTRAKRVLMVLGALAVAWAGTEVALRLTPIPPALAVAPAESAGFVDRHGHPLRILLVDDERYAQRVSLHALSPHLIAATLSAEDKRFYAHSGVDWLAVLRAGADALKTGHIGSGASTITQQLVKISDPSSRTWRSKLREIWIASALERRWSKEQILEEYFKRLDYGNLQFGAARASHFYFQKPPADLSPAESALLAALPRAPTRLDPHRDFQAARKRQLYVLERMQAGGFLSAEAAVRAFAESITLASPLRDFEAPHFVDLLLKRQGIVNRGGEIRTTLDRDINRKVTQILNHQLRRIDDKNAGSAFAVVLDNRSSAVLALAGGGDYFEGQVNGAWRPRSPGSAMKPFTFLLALERGFYPGTVVADVATDFITPTGLYRPNNYNHRFYGPVSLRFALGNSLNVASIQALKLGGGPEALFHAMHELGFTTLGHGPAQYGLGITLGNAEVRLLELANAYATLARLGEYRPYRLLEDPSSGAQAGRQLFDRANCYLIADMLADNAARASSFGLHSWLRLDFPVACKTGTSSDYRDNWAVGYTPEFTVAVWVGNLDGKSMREITGVTGAAPAMHEIFEHLHAQFGTTWFEPPTGVTTEWIDPLTGNAVARGHPRAVAELTTRPIPSGDADYDENGRVILPPAYWDWTKSAGNMLGGRVVMDASAPGLCITQPRDEAVYFLDPDLPSESQQIRLRAEGTGQIFWESPTLHIANSKSGPAVQLIEGRHFLQATDLTTLEKTGTWIEVRPW